MRAYVGVVGLVAMLVATPSLPAADAAPTASAPRAQAPGRAFDFNGDGFADLAVGVPGEAVQGNAVRNAGAVNVLPGSARGVTATSSQFWAQSSAGVRGQPTTDDGFGSALASADFDRDGRADLAVGVPGEPVGGQAASGAVNVLYGSGTGLTPARNQLWTQAGPVPGVAETRDRFGSALTAGDFNADGYADLAVGVPGEDSRGGNGGGRGAVNVLYGSRSGLVSAASQGWTQDSSGVRGQEEDEDNFGYDLTAGDFNADGFADLAVGVPGEDGDSAGFLDGPGAVNILFGGQRGLSAAGNQGFAYATPGIEHPGPFRGAVEGGPGFGRALAAGSFDGDRYDDLAVGVPDEQTTHCDDEDEGLCSGDGAVTVLRGARAGLTTEGSQYWDPERPGVPGQAEHGASFGHSLVAADFNGDGRGDLAVGAANSIGGGTYEGSVTVLPGSSSGLVSTGSSLLSRATPGIPGGLRRGFFGGDLIAADYGRSEHADLAIASDWDDLGQGDRRWGAGTVNLVYGSRTGLAAPGSQLWSQDSPGVPGTAERGEGFSVLKAAYFRP